MKKITLILAFICSIIATAQESFPGKYADLLLGKEVRVKDFPTRDSYEGFYQDENQQKIYAPIPRPSIYTKKDALLGKVFKVTATKPLSGFDNPSLLTLVGENDLHVYYMYHPALSYEYPFEVIGGLTLPDGFYCDLVKESKFGDTVSYSAFTDDGSKVSKDVSPKGTEYYLTLIAFLPKDSKPLQSATIILEGDKVLTKKSDLIIPQFQTSISFKYTYTILLNPKELALLKANKIVGIKFGEQVANLIVGNKVQGVLNCLTK